MKQAWIRFSALAAAIFLGTSLLAPAALAGQGSFTGNKGSISGLDKLPASPSDLPPTISGRQHVSLIPQSGDSEFRPAKLMPRGGSFGGGGGGRSFGGGFGGGRPSSGFGGGGTGSFGGSTRSFGGGGTSSPRTSSGGSSFGGRTGAMGSTGQVRSSSVAPSYARGYSGYPSGRYYYNGGYYPGYGGFWGGYSYGWAHPAWYFYTPFWPSFYFDGPQMYNGVLYPGGFNWFKFFLGIVLIIFIFWLIGRIFGGGKGVRYTTYR